MSTQIRPTRLEVSDRFPMLGFAIHADGSQRKCEVAVATDVALFGLDGKARRNRDNFYSSRAAGPIVATRGEAVYVLPPEVLARFAGQPRLYFAVASSRDGNGGAPEVDVMPSASSAYVSLRGLTGRSLRRIRMLPSRQQIAAGYGNGTGKELDWAGDVPSPGTRAVSGTAAPAPTAGGAPAKSAPGAVNGAPAAAPAASASALDYDDGYGPLPADDDRATATADTDEDSSHDIGGPIPDEASAPAAAAALAGGATAEYPQASRFAAAAGSNYRAVSGTRSIGRVVIHITDGGPRINGTISWFQNPAAKVSAHYVVGQDGEVVQMVKHNDVAWHAGRANGDSIGIEHVANTRGLAPTPAQYCASAALTRWLCDQFGIPVDRTHILGHAEADPSTTHKACPNAVWDWDYFMDMVTTGTCHEPRTAGGTVGGAGAATSQGLGSAITPSPKQRRAAPAPIGARRPIARPLEVVLQDYAPGNAPDALSAQLDFQTRYQQWVAGVTDTGFYPHSAICQLVRDDGGAGTGFYIAPDRILTAAHVVEGAHSINVIPGKNGGGAAGEPFGHFTVDASKWSVHPSRIVGNENNDLAVLQVSTPPPGGQFFDILEELRQSLPSNIIVCGYSAQSKDPAVTSAIDPDRQHLDGDYIRTLDDGTFQYNLQTLAGASGSPVYYVWVREDEERRQSVLEIHIVGVHVSAFSGTLNQGCRLTDEKIAWIRSVGAPAAAQSLAAAAPRRTAAADRRSNGAPHVRQSVATATRAQALGGESLSLNWDEVEMIPQPTDVTCWATAAAMVIGWRDRLSLTPEKVAEIAGRSTNEPLAMSEARAFAEEMGLTYEAPQSYTLDSFRDMLEGKGPLWVGILTPEGGGHAVVVTGMYGDGASDGSGTYVRITDPWDRDPGTPGTPGPYASTHNTGSRYILSWAEFVREYELQASNAPDGSVNAQVLHSDGNAGREPNRGKPAAYAMAAAARTRTLPSAPLRKVRSQAFGATGTIANASLQTTTGADGGVSWDLDQLAGFKTPNDAPPPPGSRIAHAAPVNLTGWPFLENEHGERIGADLTLDWQYDGKALGQVSIDQVEARNAAGCTLRITARITDDPAVYPPERPAYAALRVQIAYLFTQAGAPDVTAVVDLHLFGDGTFEQTNRWETHAA